MDFHPVTEKIVGLLKENEYWYEAFEHEAVRTSEEAARVRPEYTMNQGAKALILKAYFADGERFVMFVFPADLKLDSKKAAGAIGAKKIRFATEEEVSQITNGVELGGVPPFGNLFNIEVVVDPSLFRNEKIIFNAGDRRFSVAMMSEDFIRLVNPKIISIT